MCLWYAARWELAGLLFLHLSWVTSPEGGVPRNVGWDHQWPNTKSGVRPYSHNLLPQEVTRSKAGTEVALRIRIEKRKLRFREGNEREKGPTCRPLILSSKAASSPSDHGQAERWREGFDPADTISILELWIVWDIKHDTNEIDFWQKHRDVHPCNPAPKMKTVFCGDKAINHLNIFTQK